MIWTLAIDTATVVCAALARDGQVVGAHRVDDTRAHTEQLMPLVVQLCDEAGIALAEVDEFVVGVGPGPFTGLRVGIVTARSLAWLAGVEAHGVYTLDVVAAQTLAEASEPLHEASEPLRKAFEPLREGFIAAIDARRKEVYWARYDATGTRVDGPHVSAPTDVAVGPVAGPGAGIIAADQPDRVVLHELPVDAGVLATGWAGLPDAGLEPLYLRQPDATVPGPRKTTLLPTQLTPRRRRRQPDQLRGEQS